MNVSELIASERYALPVEVAGYLVVSSLLVYVVDSEQVFRSGAPHRGLLLRREAIAPLLALDLSPIAGSSVTHVGQVTLLGTVVSTGMTLLPLYMPHVYELRFRQAPTGPEHHLRISEPFRDVYLKRPTQLPTAALRPLARFLDPQLSVLQVRERLLAQDELLLAEHLDGPALRTLLELLQSHDLAYRVELTPIGLSGQP